MLRFCRFLEYNFIILKYACNRFELQFSYFPCKNWIVEVFIKFQIPKRISARFFPHCFQDGLFAQFGPNECVHQIPLLHFAKSSLSCSWVFSGFKLLVDYLHSCSFSISHFLSWVISCALLVDYLQKLRQVIMIGHETMLTKNLSKKFMGISSFDHFYCFTKYFYKY